MKYIEVIGKKYGKLRVQSLDHKKGNKEYYKCVCDCGREKVAYKSHITTGLTKSCGCLKREPKKHGDSTRFFRTRLYSIWLNMNNRCRNENDKNFKNYGGRGIKVCKQWENDYKKFRDWALANGYKENLTIDRIDVNGGYEPSNCRWATRTQQMRNRRDNVWLEINGVKMIASDWAKIKGVPTNTLCRRIKNGVPKDRLFEKGWIR